MPRLYLPLPDRRPNKLVVRDPETGREMIVFIAGADQIEKSQYAYIVEGQKEITLNQLKKKGPRQVGKLSKEEVAGALRDFIAWRNQKRDDPGHRRVF